MFELATRRKPEEYAAARRLRAQGTPYRRIATALGVSPSSVYLWTSDIELTAEQHRRNLHGPEGPLNPEGTRRRAAAWSERCRRHRAEYQEEGRRHVSVGDPLHLAGCMLYWAEGSKGRNTAQLVNSDVRMLRLFRRFLTECLDVDLERLRFKLNVYTGNGLTIREIEQYWLDALQLPSTSVRKHTLNHMPTSSSGKARSKLPYGVCTLSVARSTPILHHIYGAIQEYAGFEEPRWLG